MKKVLITGVNSYVGNSFYNLLQQYPHAYDPVCISLQNDNWKAMDFSKYDVVLHVAGLVHRKETKKNKHLYYIVNRDLTEELAQKAKKEGVRQFVFLSSMSVYGMRTGIIDKNTIPNPDSYYGDSKLQAETIIKKISNSSFKLAILRPPMIYGKGCKGNYQRLRKLATVTPVFPDVKNKRSMIYIENLTEFIKMIIDNDEMGVFYPQNKEYVNTSMLTKCISYSNDKPLTLIKVSELLYPLLKTSVGEKMFGDLVYSKKTSKYNFDYNRFTFECSIKRTEVKDAKNKKQN